MASYKYAQYLAQSQDASFDQLHKPGQHVPFSRIYRCMGCGREIAANHPDPFPPQNHHQHPNAQTPIQWKMVVWADHNAK